MKKVYSVAMVMPQTERQRWELATRHIRERYPGIQWTDDIVPKPSLARDLESLHLDFASRLGAPAEEGEG